MIKRKLMEKQHTTLLLTVNTNSTDQKYKQILRETALKFMKNIGTFLTFRGKFDKPKISNIKTEYCIETSTKGLIHTHILCTITHTPKVKKDKVLFNLNYVRKYFDKLTNRHCYVNCRFSGDSAWNLSMYLKK